MSLMRRAGFRPGQNVPILVPSLRPPADHVGGRRAAL